MKQWVKVTNEGIKEHLFGRNKTAEETKGTGADTEESVPIDSTIVRSKNNSDDIAMVRSQGLMVDDNNEPAPENILYGTTIESSTTNCKWVWNGQCHQKLMVVHNLQPKFNIDSGIHLDVLGYVAIFLIFFKHYLLKQSS